MKKAGFTLVELIIVIGIIGLLSVLSLLSLSNVRTRARDMRRVADMYHIANALEFYYSQNNSYPVTVTPGASIEPYMAVVPSNPFPRFENSCSNNDYSYLYSTSSNQYAIGYCLGGGIGNLDAGLHIAIPGSLTQYGLFGWWRFDESNGTQIIDSASNFTGTLYGATRESACRLGYCLHFDGVDDYVGLNSSTPTGSKTIVGWIYTDNISNNHQAIFGNKLALIHSSGRLAHDGGTGYLFSTGLISQQQWTYVGFVFDNTANTLTFYINGEASGTVALNSFNITSNNIGILTPGSGDNVTPFIGKIDDLRLYSRALPDVEILALYNASK